MSGDNRSLTVGIDLASQPKGTAACTIAWRSTGGWVLPPEERPLTDAVILELLRDPAIRRVGIDAPFGWPTEFVEAVTTFGATGRWSVPDAKRLEFRETDLHTKAVVGQEPLSVTTDWLVWAAWRCARILAELPDWSIESRLGDGRLLEVYPAAALHRWGVSPSRWDDDPGSYKGPGADRRSRRERLLDLLVSGCCLDLGGQAARFIESDHELDALVAALVARAADTEDLEPVPASVRDRAVREGWIRLPRQGAALAALGPRS